MGRPIEVPDDAVIKAGEALLAEGKAVYGTRLWLRLGKRGRADRMITVWNKHVEASAHAPQERFSQSPLPEPAARLLSDCKAQLGAGMDACVHEIYALVERTLVGRFQAELAATAASRAAHQAELQETLHALGELADEHDAALLQVQESTRDVLIAQTTLQAERELSARIEMDRVALSARVDSLIADLSATAGLVQAAEADRSRAGTLVETTRADLHATQATLDGVRAAGVTMEREVGAARQAGQLQQAQLDRQADEIRDLRTQLAGASERHLAEATRAAGAERALAVLERSMASRVGRRTVTYNTREKRWRPAGPSPTDETRLLVGPATIDNEVSTGPRP